MDGRSLLLSLAFVLFASPSFSYQFGLSPVQTSTIGVGCYDVKTADLNGDGIPDVVAAVVDAQRLTVMLGTPTGLSAPTHYPSGHADAVDLADYDGNGSIDILDAEWNEDRIRLWLNQGNGTFVLSGSTAVSTNPRDVAGGDFDGNGTRDVAVATGDGKVVILSGQPGGGFAAAGSLAPGGSIKGIAAGDLDNDGDLDLAAIDATGRRLLRLRNDGAMTFVLASARTFSGSPSDIALGQLDGDGFLDAAVSLESNFVAVIGGGPDFSGSIGTFGVGSLSQSVAIADFDGEGGPDLLVSNWSLNNAQVLRNLGALQFGASVAGQTGANPRSAAAADFNGDGRMDVVSGDFGAGIVTVLRNVAGNPRLAFSPPVLAFGQGAQGVPSVKTVLLQNTGTTPLVVMPGAIDGAEFQYSGANDPITIQAGTSTTLGVRYLRTTLGDATGTLHFSSNDSIVPEAAVPLSGTAVPANPEISIAPLALDFGSGALGSPRQLSLTITNLGNAPAVVTPGAIDSAEFDYVGSGNQAFNLQPGTSELVAIRYNRSVLGDATGTVHVTTGDVDHPAFAIPLSGNAAPPNPEIEFTPTSLNFGSSYVGDLRLLSITFTNPGNAPVTVTPGAIDGDEFDSSSSAFVLAAGEGTTLAILYKRSVVGDATGTFHLTTTDSDHPELAIALTGSTVPKLTKVSYAPLTLDFGSDYLGITTVRSVTFQNVGNQPLTVTPGVIEGAMFAFSPSGSAFTLNPGGTRSVNLSMTRTVVGDANGILHVATTDPAQAAIDIPLMGTTLPSFPKITVTPASLDFGSAFAGIQQVLSVTIKNEGHASLSVTPSAIDGNEFVYEGPATPFNLAIGASRTVSVRYLRTITGPTKGLLHLSNNDPDAPDVEIWLFGSAAAPPIAAFSLPVPITVSAGHSAPATVVVRNLGESPLQITVPPQASDLREANAFDLGPTTSPFWRLGASGQLWNFDWEGQVVTGGNNEYNRGMDESNFFVQSAGIVGLGGREFRLGPVAIAGGTTVTRKIFIPESGDWVRYIDVAENPGELARTATFDLVDNLGFGPTDPIRTSDGDSQFELTDDWIVVPATDRRSVGRVFRSVGAANVPVLAIWFQSTAPGCYSRTKYVVTLAPHERTCVIQWAVQGENADATQAIVESLRQDPGPGLVHADAIDRGTAWNLVPDANPFRPVAGNHVIAPNDSAEIAVVFGAEAATHDADLTSMLRLTTNDPQHPVLAVPLAFSIANGLVVGAEPPSASMPASIELTGFRPNPLRLSGSARVAFRLATNEPATLTFYDVRGRTLARQAIPTPAPGPGSVALTGTSLAPGVVWMRLEQGGRTVTGKGIALP